MLNYVLYRARLVPRWISTFGLLAAASILAARVMLISGLELSSGYCQLEPFLARLDARPRKQTREYGGFPSCGLRVLPQTSLKLTRPSGQQLRESALAATYVPAPFRRIKYL